MFTRENYSSRGTYRSMIVVGASESASLFSIVAVRFCTEEGGSGDEIASVYYG